MPETDTKTDLSICLFPMLSKNLICWLPKPHRVGSPSMSNSNIPTTTTTGANQTSTSADAQSPPRRKLPRPQ
jgi:hypothetical protein